MRQALLNLLLNGYQAMPSRGRLIVRVGTDRGGAVDFARVEVTDSGPGIPDELRGRIFEPFFSTRATGAGLGLAVVRRIMRAHGGDVTVDSGPRGTTFVLRLPIGATVVGEP